MGPGPSGSASSRAMRRFAVGFRIRFDGSMAGSGGAGDDDHGSRSMSKNSKGGDDGGGASGKSKSLSFI